MSNVSWDELKIKKVLKLLIKKSGLTYKDFGERLSLSEATVKRRVNSSDLSIRQLSQMCEVLDVEFLELIELSRKFQNEPSQFNFKQEQLLAEDTLYFSVFRLLVLKKTNSEMTRILGLSNTSLKTILFKLEKVNLIEIYPDNKINLLLSFPFKWIDEGPMEKTYFKKSINNIFNQIQNQKYKPSLKCRSFELKLSKEQYKSFTQEFDSLFQKYRSYSEIELKARSQKSETVSGLFFTDYFSLWHE